jgi:UDP-N-acetylmuramate: L-alanyl-gamma-D-glutamyl-meso-diaminopimelate ligase
MKIFTALLLTFEGAANRLQLLGKNEQTTIYKDFAHSPSKLSATTKAMKQQFAQQHLIAVMELHTFSSLNKKILNQYAGSMNFADTPVVFFR